MKIIDPHMHTAEHILNQTVIRVLGCGRCFSAHIEKKKSKCDYRIAAAPTPENIQAIEKQVNRMIKEKLEVRTMKVARREAARRYDLNRLPEGTGDTIRIVMVGDYDACPCSGDHVAHTGKLGSFRVTSWNHENGVLRIRFKLNRAAAGV